MGWDGSAEAVRRRVRMVVQGFLKAAEAHPHPRPLSRWERGEGWGEGTKEIGKSLRENGKALYGN